LRLAVEHSDLLRHTVFVNSEIVLGKRARRCTVSIENGGEDVDQLDVNADGGGVVLDARGERLRGR
jgi:hypothetical protein